MGKVIVMNFVTLDGVFQAPGRPDEDTRSGFEHSGWGVPFGDEATVAKMGERTPIVLGSGRRLFTGGTPASLRLLDCGTTTKGVLMAVYKPAQN